MVKTFLVKDVLAAEAKREDAGSDFEKRLRMAPEECRKSFFLPVIRAILH